MTRTALLDTDLQESTIPLQMIEDALQNGYDLNSNVEEIDFDRRKQVSKDSGHRIGLFVTAGCDDVIVLGTNALKKLDWSLTPNAQSSEGRAEVSRGRRHQRREAKAKKAAVQQ
ncbi:unnamed protein product [Heligmosomoides polygyrus]|uniref:DUF5615 domain-containing protein n=1 Tax=Heligmosomoides polygyrus TaxID=6339 RepID=A0A183G7X2_HELPZ|nr:unnamed protein product [Heligmosomoides polygyrus]